MHPHAPTSASKKLDRSRQVGIKVPIPQEKSNIPEHGNPEVKTTQVELCAPVSTMQTGSQFHLSPREKYKAVAPKVDRKDGKKGKKCPTIPSDIPLRAPKLKDEGAPIGPPMIPIKVDQVGLKAVLDTGCSRTLATSGMMKKVSKFGWEKDLVPSKVRLNSATGHSL